ncbi:LuxR family transcriptional regulator [Clostridiales bacterium PH28_bin88]|nr:LuxR family transcriptional regulator [Clostridiales bacterium PH28_bin88]
MVDCIKLLIVDDHEVVRLGLRYLFEQHGHFSVVGEAQSAVEALAKVETCRPDVVIMDIRLPRGSGIDACREITTRYHDTQVVMLTSYGDEETVLESIMAGAKGYVLKDVGNDELIRAVEAAGRGESLLDPMITAKLLEHLRRVPRGNQDTVLTKQERKVLALIAEGRTNREIAKTIYLSEKTVRNYVSAILNKLNLSNRAEAAAYAAKHKLDA